MAAMRSIKNTPKATPVTLNTTAILKFTAVGRVSISRRLVNNALRLVRARRAEPPILGLEQEQHGGDDLEIIRIGENPPCPRSPRP